MNSVFWLLARISSLYGRLSSIHTSANRQDMLQLVHEVQTIHMEICNLSSTLDPPYLDPLLSISSYDNMSSLSVAVTNVLLSSALYNASIIYINRLLQRASSTPIAGQPVLPRSTIQAAHRIVAAHIIERKSKHNPLRVCRRDHCIYTTKSKSWDSLFGR